MGHKQNPSALKGRAEKSHRRALAKRAQARRASLKPMPTVGTVPLAATLFEEKLSATIWEFAAPLTDAAVTTVQQERAVSVAILAWNAALSPELQAREMLDEAIRRIADGDTALEKLLRETLDMMVARKHALFSDDRRLVVSNTLTDTPSGMRLEVASALIPPAPRS
jgi:hypothetical protein